MSKQEPSTVAAGAEPLASEPGLARALEPGVVVLGGRGLRTRHGGQDPRGETRGRGGRARGDWGSSPFVLPHALPRPSPSRVKCASLSCPAPAHAEGKPRCPLGMPGLRAPGVESPPAPLPCFLPPFLRLASPETRGRPPVIGRLPSPNRHAHRHAHRQSSPRPPSEVTTPRSPVGVSLGGRGRRRGGGGGRGKGGRG